MSSSVIIYKDLPFSTCRQERQHLIRRWRWISLGSSFLVARCESPRSFALVILYAITNSSFINSTQLQMTARLWTIIILCTVQNHYEGVLFRLILLSHAHAPIDAPSMVILDNNWLTLQHLCLFLSTTTYSQALLMVDISAQISNWKR